MLGRLLPEPIKKPLRRMRFRMRLALEPLELMPNAPELFGTYRRLQRHPDLDRQPGGWVYKGGFYPDYLTEGGASGAIFRDALRFCEGTGVDMGAGLWPLPGSVPVDLYRGPGAEHSISEFDDGSLDYLFSSHCLEHIADWQAALDEWTRKIRPGGVLFLYLPHPDCAIWHPGSPFVGDGHKWSPTPAVIRQAVEDRGLKILARNDGPDAMQSFYVCARQGGAA